MLYSPSYSFVSAATPEHFRKRAPSTSATGSTLSKSFARGRHDSIPGVTRHVGASRELSPLAPQSTRQHGKNPFGSQLSINLSTKLPFSNTGTSPAHMAAAKITLPVDTEGVVTEENKIPRNSVCIREASLESECPLTPSLRDNHVDDDFEMDLDDPLPQYCTSPHVRAVQDEEQHEAAAKVPNEVNLS